MASLPLFVKWLVESPGSWLISSRVKIQALEVPALKISPTLLTVGGLRDLEYMKRLVLDGKKMGLLHESKKSKCFRMEITVK